MRSTQYAAGLVVATLLLTGCASIPQPRTDAEADWKPIPSEQELAATNERFDTVAVRALTDLETKPLATVFDGPLLRTNRTAVELARKSDSHTIEPTSHRDPVFHRPTFDDYPIWYLTESTTASEASEADDAAAATTSLTVVQSTGADQQWRRVLDTDLPTDTLPKLEPTAIPNDEEQRLGRTPTSIVRSFTDLLLSSKRDRRTDLFSDHEVVSNLHSKMDTAREHDGEDFNYDLSAEPTLVRTIGTADGGALMLFTVRVREDVAMLGGALFRFPEKDSPIRIQLGQETFRTYFSRTEEWTVAAEVPARDAKDQRIELLSVRADFVRAEGR